MNELYMMKDRCTNINCYFITFANWFRTWPCSIPKTSLLWISLQCISCPQCVFNFHRFYHSIKAIECQWVCLFVWSLTPPKQLNLMSWNLTFVYSTSTVEKSDCIYFIFSNTTTEYIKTICVLFKASGCKRVQYTTIYKIEKYFLSPLPGFHMLIQYTLFY